MNLRRIAAAAAILLVVGVFVVTITAISGEVARVLGQLALFVVVLAAGWMVVSRSGSARILGVVVAVAAIVAIALLQAGGPDADLVSLVLRILAVVVGDRTRAIRDRHDHPSPPGGGDARDPGGDGDERRPVHEPQVGWRQG